MLTLHSLFSGIHLVHLKSSLGKKKERRKTITSYQLPYLELAPCSLSNRNSSSTISASWSCLKCICYNNELWNQRMRSVITLGKLLWCHHVVCHMYWSLFCQSVLNKMVVKHTVYFPYHIYVLLIPNFPKQNTIWSSKHCQWNITNFRKY